MAACRDCDGAGWTTEADHAPDCRAQYGGPCDGACPVPIQAQCGFCSGTGIDPPYCEQCDEVHTCGEAARWSDRGCGRDITHLDHGICADCRDLGRCVFLEPELAIIMRRVMERARCNCGWRGQWTDRHRSTMDNIWHGIMADGLRDPERAVGTIVLARASDLGQFV